MSSTTHVGDDRLLWDAMTAAYQWPTVTVSHEIGIFTGLENGALSTNDLARDLSIPPRSIEAVADVLVGLGLCAWVGGKLELTNVARTYLLPTSPGYWGPMLTLWRETTIDHASVLEAVRAGGRRIPAQGGTDLWEEHGLSAERARAFTAAMEAHSRSPAQKVAMSSEFAGCRRLLDVGGGSGCFAIAIACRNPGLSATIMDLPFICPIAEEYICDAGLSARVDARPGDMFDPNWPRGYDAVFLSNVFHDWNAQQCLRIAQNAFAALPASGTIHLNEMIKSDVDGGPLPIACNSVDMLLYTEGRQYRRHEIDEMLTEVGFVNVRVTPVTAYFSLISATKP